ncbi:MAG: AzlC family ABC transporter permease [Mediterraneibacter gnavus]
MIYGLTDENYSLLCSYKETDGVNEKWVHIFSTILLWVYWITFSGIGGLVGEMIPFDTTGIDFALTALFVVIFVDMIRGTKAKLPALVATLSSVLWIVLVGTERFLFAFLAHNGSSFDIFKPYLSKGMEEKT